MFLLNVTGSEIIVNIRDFFYLVFSEFAKLWFWPVIMIGLMILAFFVMLIVIGTSYENRILKSINKLNTYLFSKPFITDENLVEFNLKMKKVPKALRNNWQIYMLNREDTPSAYINSQTCIDKPLMTSSIEKHMGNFGIFTILLTALSFVVGLQYSIISNVPNADIGALFYASLVPVGVVFLYVLFILIIKLIKNDVYATLYDNFPLFERNLTKAVSTLPSYVDYEILFTKKEIKEGIPILQQYLEKRALIEQQELEKARENSAACEEYNFDELGIDGSLVLERAMKECETFIKTRRRLQEEMDEIETEKENYKKNFETTEKDFQRKLQASRENLESLKAQQEASTNRIESNYIKKQQSDEIKKQQQLEKDSEEATTKFKEEQVTLEQEVEKRKQEIEEKRSFVEQAMLLEFKHYANTLYKALSVKAAELGNQKVMNLAQENADLKGVLNDLQGIQGPAPSVQDNLVKAEEVGSGNLYEMSKNDESNLEAGREELNEKAKEEDKKEKEREESKKREQDVNAEVQENPENANPENVDTDVSASNEGDDTNVGDGSNEGTGAVVESESDGVDDNAGSNADGGESGTDFGDFDTNTDGGQEMNSEDLGKGSEQEKEDDIEELQRKIEEENANLQKQKEEFAKDLDKTISQMDTPQGDLTTDAKEEPSLEEKPQSEPKVEESPIVKEEHEMDEVSSANDGTQVKENENVEVDEKPTTSSETSSVGARRVSRTSAASQGARRAPNRNGRDRTSSGASARKVNSEIDALNAEMEKLLDSTKK